MITKEFISNQNILEQETEEFSGFISRYGAFTIFKNKKDIMKALKEHRKVLMNQLLDIERAIIELSLES